MQQVDPEGYLQAISQLGNENESRNTINKYRTLDASATNRSALNDKSPADQRTTLSYLKAREGSSSSRKELIETSRKLLFTKIAIMDKNYEAESFK